MVGKKRTSFLMGSLLSKHPQNQKSLTCFFNGALTLGPAVPYRADCSMAAYVVSNVRACVTNFTVLKHTSPSCAMEVSYAQALQFSLRDLRSH